MARAVFQVGQRVFVKPIGAWAIVQQLAPQWVSGVEEPLRILYEVGLGRHFAAHELCADPRSAEDATASERWRLVRLSNRWHTNSEAVSRHPHPGTYPVVMTDEADWGGWRVPAAEYDRDPDRIEHQARIIANALRLLRLARQISDAIPEGPAMKALAEAANQILHDVDDLEPAAPASAPVHAAMG